MAKGLFSGLRKWARLFRREVHVLYLAARHPRTPRPVKLLALLVVAYALSPVDLIPDFIPLLGYLDDVVILPLGIALVVRLIPRELMAELRRQADLALPTFLRKWGLALVIVSWVLILGVLLWFFFR